MSIKGNLGEGPVNIGTTDTVLFIPGIIDRYHVGAFAMFNDTANTVTVDIYISPNVTSASGIKVESISLAADQAIDINAVIGQGYTALNIIGVASAVGLNSTITRTEYTNGD